MSKELMQGLLRFIKALEKDPRDVELRGIYADFLEEHGLDDEAAEQRAWSLKRYEAEQYLRRFCVEAHANYDDLLRDVSKGNGYCFGDEVGPYMVDDDEFWEAVRILTGKEPSRNQSFSCAC